MESLYVSSFFVRLYWVIADLDEEQRVLELRQDLRLRIEGESFFSHKVAQFKFTCLTKSNVSIYFNPNETFSGSID